MLKGFRFGLMLCLVAASACCGVETEHRAFAVGVPVTVQDDRARDRDAETFAEKFEVVWKRIRDRFYDPKLHGLDWNQVGTTYRTKLEGVRTKADFAALINRMLGELKASHTEYITDDDVNFTMLPAVLRGDIEASRVVHIGVMGRHEAEGYRVAGVLEGGPADAAGIRSRDLLMTADDEAFTTAGAFRGKEDREVTVTLRREGEREERRVTLTPVRENMLRAFLDATKKSARILEVNGKRIGYIHLWTMAHAAFRDALHEIVLGRLYDTDGLILDIRDGYGGRPEGFSNPFFLPDVTWEQEMRGMSSPPRRSGYAKPMVVLINGGTRSAKEHLAYQFKKTRRATLVGTRTAGAFLGASGFPVGKDGLLEIAIVGLKLDGKRLEGVGISPDVEVPARDTYAAGDSQLARAREILLAQIASKKKESVRAIANPQTRTGIHRVQ